MLEVLVTDFSQQHPLCPSIEIGHRHPKDYNKIFYFCNKYPKNVTNITLANKWTM